MKNSYSKKAGKRDWMADWMMEVDDIKERRTTQGTGSVTDSGREESEVTGQQR